MTWDKALELLKTGETANLEFIPQVSGWEDIAQEMVAFSNGAGGRIVVGLDDKNKYLTGVDFNKEELLSIAHDRCVPRILPQVDAISRAGKNVFIIHVPEGNIKPYSTSGTIYIREGRYTRAAKKDEEEKLKGPWQTSSLNTRQKKALQFISDEGSISNRDYRSLTGVSHKTAHLELIALTKKKILVTRGSGRSTRYFFHR